MGDKQLRNIIEILMGVTAVQQKICDSCRRFKVYFLREWRNRPGGALGLAKVLLIAFQQCCLYFFRTFNGSPFCCCFGVDVRIKGNFNIGESTVLAQPTGFSHFLEHPVGFLTHLQTF